MRSLYIIFALTLPSWETYDEHQQTHALDNGSALFPDALVEELEREWMEIMTQEDEADQAADK